MKIKAILRFVKWHIKAWHMLLLTYFHEENKYYMTIKYK